MKRIDWKSQNVFWEIGKAKNNGLEDILNTYELFYYKENKYIKIIMINGFRNMHHLYMYVLKT